MMMRTFIAATVLFLCSPDRIPAQNISALWANDGGDKVTWDELRADAGLQSVTNHSWDAETVLVRGARNEVAAFNLILEAAETNATNVTVHFDRLTGPSQFEIATSHDDVFSWTNRHIELFHVRYLEIKGLSRLTYDNYDERHIPQRLRRPWSGEGVGSGTWMDRPDHNAFYPDIAVPLELATPFDISAGRNQSIWVDVYIPSEAPAGLYTGMVQVIESGLYTQQVPVQLTVHGFTLPDRPYGRTMLVLGYGDINLRYLNESHPNAGTTNAALSRLIRDRHYMMAHRHRISLIDNDGGGAAWPYDAPRPEWVPRLNGELFTHINGYDGPGVGVGNGVYSIGTYGSWGWKNQGETGMWHHADGWVTWFSSNAPATSYFLYLIDESLDYPQIEQWSQWIENNPGPGSNLLSMATLHLPSAVVHTPSLDIPASGSNIGVSNVFEEAAAAYTQTPGKYLFCYNGTRPQSGSFATEDDGVALWVTAWAQFKKRIDRWFYWESTYYNNFQGGMGQTRVFQTAKTFGTLDSTNSVLGETGWNYTNGDGVLFYPGTDQLFPDDSLDILGPVASLRLKQWRRGIQDIDYLSMASYLDPVATEAIVMDMIPEILWEYGVNDTNDPTWVRTDISWSTDPDVWAAAREQLVAIIETAHANHRVVLESSAVGPAVYSVSWPPLGTGFLHTVEFTDSLQEPDWQLAPGTWPSATNTWELDSETMDATTLYFRIHSAFPVND